MSKEIHLNRKSFREYIDSAEEGMSYAVAVRGRSMFPCLLDGVSVVYLRKPKAGEYSPKKGDIVFFRRKSGAYVLHRIYKVKKDATLVINGDAQNWFEETEVSAVCGVVERFLRKKHTISVNNPAYKIAVSLWQLILPLRPAIFKTAKIFKNRRK